MATEAHSKNDAQWLFADHATDFGAAPATAANSLIVGTPTDIQIDLTNVAADGGGRASAKATLGASTRAMEFSVDACIEFEAAPTDNDLVDFYWAASPSSTAGTGNPAALTGADEAFTPTDGKLGQLSHIGSLTCRANVINIGHVGIFEAPHPYGMLVVVNNADQAMRSTATAMDETHIVIQEVHPELQDA